MRQAAALKCVKFVLQESGEEEQQKHLGVC